MRQSIRAVLFDLGDTLWHFPEMPPMAEIVRESGQRIEAELARWGLPARSGAELAAAVIEADREATRQAEFSHGRSPDFAGLVRERARAHGMELDVAQSAAVWDALHVGGLFLKRNVFPDSIPLLEELRRRGYRVGSVTNRSLGGDRFREELRRIAMHDLFECMIVSCDEGWLKPHRTLFERAIASLGVTAEETVMVGDDLRADVMGAKALGMIAVWKRSPGRSQEPHLLPDGTVAHPDFVIDHPGELLELPPFTPSGGVTSPE